MPFSQQRVRICPISHNYVHCTKINREHLSNVGLSILWCWGVGSWTWGVNDLIVTKLLFTLFVNILEYFISISGEYAYSPRFPFSQRNTWVWGLASWWCYRLSIYRGRIQHDIEHQMKGRNPKTWLRLWTNKRHPIHYGWAMGSLFKFFGKKILWDIESALYIAIHYKPCITGSGIFHTN